jgi:hypothetical protein
MFRRGLVFQAECPDPHCTRANCHFLHPQPPHSNTNSADDTLTRESGWKLLQDLKQLPPSQHDTYTPAVLDDAHALDALGHGDEEHALDDAPRERGVKRKVSDSQRAEDTPNKRGKYDAAPLTSAQPEPLTAAPPRTPSVPAPPRDVMGPLIPAKKFTVDNFLGTVAAPSQPAPPTHHKSVRQRVNPSSQALSSETCPIVPYTPNSHIDRAVRQKVVDRLYAHLTRVNAGEAVQQALDLELEIYRSCQGRTSYLHQSRVLFSELERK